MKLKPEDIMKEAREARAEKCKPGSEQEIAWHAIVPEKFRKPQPEKPNELETHSER